MESHTDIFPNECFSPIDFGHEDVALRFKEFLQLYKIQKKQKPKTLVVFIGHVLGQDIIDILHELETGQNVVVILVSQYPDIITLSQFPRHRKFLLAENVDELLIEVIKNPNYDRFEFKKFLPDYRDRSCLANVTVVLVVSAYHSASVMQYFWQRNNSLVVNLLSNYNAEILNIQTLLDTAYHHDVLQNNIHLFNHFPTYLMNFRAVSFARLTETGVLAGNETKIFFFFPNHFLYESRKMKVKKLLETNSQVVVEWIYWIRKYDSYSVLAEKLLDHLVDIGCQRHISDIA